MKWSVFEQPVYGRRAPEHRVKFFYSQNIIVEVLQAETTCRNESPALPADFFVKNLDFCPFLGSQRLLGRP